MRAVVQRVSQASVSIEGKAVGAIGRGVAQLAAVPLVLCIVPGLGLGLVNRWLPAALVQLLIAIPVGFVLWRFA